MTMNKTAFIFDLDGVLTDTAECHYLAWKQLAEEHSLQFDRDFNERLKGVSRIDSLKLILRHNTTQVNAEVFDKMTDKKNNYYLDHIQEITPNDLLPGALDVLQALKARNTRIALGSASKNARLVLDKLQISGYFHVIGDGNSVERSKPAPDLFLFAAKALDVDPKDCVVIEDSQAGIDAAKSAGMVTIAIGLANNLKNADHYFVSMTEANIFLKNVEEKNS